MKISLIDGSVKEFANGLTVKEIASEIAISLGKQSLGAIVNDNFIVNNSTKIINDCKVELITNKSELEKKVAGYTGGLAVFKALSDLYSVNGYNVIPNDDGDFSVIIKTDLTFNKDDLDNIEKEANILVKNICLEVTNHVFKKDNVAQKNLDMFVGIDSDFIDNLQKSSSFELSTYKIKGQEDSFLPICAFYEDGTKIKQIKLMSSSSYQDGNSEEKYQLIRGISATNEQYLKEYIEKEEEKRKRDHRFIGKQLEIFTLDPLIGQGLPIWLPNGTIIKDEIKTYLKEKEWEYDFIQIQTPIIGTSDLYKTSGHWDHYRDDMFASMLLPKEEMVLKPMSCPHHISVYNFKPRSYRELPLRFAEHALQHRYESSGSLTGLERVRAMELTDSHIFCRTDQISEVFKTAFKLIQEVLETFNIKIDYLSFSVRDPQDKEKYFDNDKMWNDAEKQLESVLNDLGVEYKRMVGEAAFYGPKLDIQAKTILGHEITVSTLQLDFLLPEKFDLRYINEEGGTSRPVMIHRGLIGTYERFISVLLEQTGGVLPVWLSPRQVEIIPVNTEEHLQYCELIKKEFKKNKIRSNIDIREERLNYKIRDAQVNKVPFTLVIGNDEQNNKTVTYREYGKQEQTTVGINEFVNNIVSLIQAKK